MLGRVSSSEVAAIATDPEVLDRFYREHIGAVEGFVARRVGDPYLVADLTADVFLAAIQAAGSYSGGRGAPIAWLYGIARNVVANEWRHRAGESRTLRRISGRELVADADLAGLHERIDAESAGRRLHAELGRLSERDRAVLELVALDDLTVSEAAHALGITAVTARVRLHRARRALQARLPEPNLGIDERAEVIS